MANTNSMLRAGRIAYNFSEQWAAAVEHYADYGYISHFFGLNRQNQTGFVVVDYGESTDPGFA